MSWASKWWLHAKAMRHEVTIVSEAAAGGVLSKKKMFWKISQNWQNLQNSPVSESVFW